MGFMPASGGVRSRAEPETVSSIQVEEIPPAPVPARSAACYCSALF